MITLSNQQLTVTINPLGAELMSIKHAGKEFLWQGDPAVWSGRAPIMFPICGEQSEGGYLADGATYRFAKRHGFARTSTFEVESATDTTATLVLRDNAETRAMYPYAFVFRVTFTLDENTISVTYAVENPDDKPMYCSVGAHEAYACPEGIDAYEVVFEQPEAADRYLLDDNGHLTGETAPIFENTVVYAPKAADFELDAVVTKTFKSRRVVLRQRDGGRQVTVAFPDHPYVLFWQKPGAPYLCIEPWCGVAQSVGGDRRIEKFEGINEIAPHDVFTRTHTITLAVGTSPLK